MNSNKFIESSNFGLSKVQSEFNVTLFPINSSKIEIIDSNHLEKEKQVDISCFSNEKYNIYKNKSNEFHDHQNINRITLSWIRFIYSCIYVFMLQFLGTSLQVTAFNTNSEFIMSTIAGNGTEGYNGDHIAASSATLSNVQGIASDGLYMYLSDQAVNRIRSIDHETGIITTYAGNGQVGNGNSNGNGRTTAAFNGPSNLHYYSLTFLYVPDIYSGIIRQIKTSTNIVTNYAGLYGMASSWGDGGRATSAGFFFPSCVFRDTNGDMYVGEKLGYRIRKIDNTINHIITTFVGTGANSASADGQAGTSSSITGVDSIFMDSVGLNLYFTQYDNNIIKKISMSTLIVTTVAGSGDSTISTTPGKL